MLSRSLPDSLRSAGLLPFVDYPHLSSSTTVEASSYPTIVLAVYDNEIKRPLRAVPYGSALGEYLLPQLDRAHFTNDDGTYNIRSLSQLKPLIGYEWKESEWRVEVSTQTDIDGYQYAHGWHLLNKRCKMRIDDNILMNVRRKKWIRTLSLRSGELAAYSQLSDNTAFVPYELLLTIKRADLHGFTSATYVEVYLDGKLVDKTSNGPSEWNKLIVVPFYSLPDTLRTRVTCVVKSDALFDKLHPDHRVKGEAAIDISDILSTQSLFSSSAMMMTFERDYAFLASHTGKLTVGINFIEHHLFKIEIDSLSSSTLIYDTSSPSTSTRQPHDDHHGNGQVSAEVLMLKDDFLMRMEALVHQHFDTSLLQKFPKVLFQLKEFVHRLSVTQESFVKDLTMDVLSLLHAHRNLLPSISSPSSSLSSSSSMISSANKPSGTNMMSCRWNYAAMNIINESLLRSYPMLVDHLVHRAQQLTSCNHAITSQLSSLSSSSSLSAKASISFKYTSSLHRHQLILHVAIPSSSPDDGDEPSSYRQVMIQLSSQYDMIMFLRALAMALDGSANDASDVYDDMILFHASDVQYSWMMMSNDKAQKPTSSKSSSLISSSSYMMSGEVDIFYHHPAGEWHVRCQDMARRDHHMISVAQVAAVEAGDVMGLPCSHLLKIAYINSSSLSPSYMMKMVDMMAQPSEPHRKTSYTTKLPSSSSSDHSIDAVDMMSIPIDMDWILHLSEQPTSIAPILSIHMHEEPVSNHPHDMFSGMGMMTAAAMIASCNVADHVMKMDIISCQALPSLDLTIKSGASLLGVDIGGMSDPYTIIYLLDADGEPVIIPSHLRSASSCTSPSKSMSSMFRITKRTSTSSYHHRSEYHLPAESVLFVSEVQDKSCNPVWNASYHLPASWLAMGRYIAVEVWDANRLTAHTCLGICKLAIDFAAMMTSYSNNNDKVAIGDDIILPVSACDKIPRKFLNTIQQAINLGSLSLQTRWLPAISNDLSSEHHKLTVSMQVKCRPLTANDAYWPCCILGSSSTASSSSSTLSPETASTKSSWDDPYHMMQLYAGHMDHLIIQLTGTNQSVNISSSSILKECTEYDSHNNQICIPWEQLQPRSLVALAPMPVLSCDVTLHRRFSAGSVRDISLTLFIAPCHVNELQLLFMDRMSVCQLRPQISPTLIPPSLKVDSLRTVLGPFTKACELVDTELKALTKEPPSQPHRSTVYLRQYDVLKRLKTRLHLYCSYMIDISFIIAADPVLSSGSNPAITSSSSSKNNINRVDQCLATMNRADSINPNLSLLYHFEEFAEALKLDVWQLSMERRFSAPDSLCDELTYFIHAAYLHLIQHLRLLVSGYHVIGNDDQSTGTGTGHGHAVLVAETKRQLLRAIIVKDNLFADALQPALAAFELKFSRTPLLTHSLKFDELQREMFGLLTDEINYFLNNSLINNKLSAHKQQLNDNNTSPSPSSFNTPWIVEHDDGDYLKVSSRIPEDTQFQMHLQIESRIIFPLLQWGARNISIIQACNFKIASAVAESYLKLASEYMDAIRQCCSDADIKIMELMKNRSFLSSASEADDVNTIEDQVIEFLCSIINDTERIAMVHIPSCKQLLARRSTSSCDHNNLVDDVNDEDQKLGIPLLHEDVDLIFEKVSEEIIGLARYATSRMVTRFYTSLAQLFLIDVEAPYLSSSSSPPAAGIADLCGTIAEFARYVRQDLLVPSFHSSFLRDLFTRLYYRFFWLARDLRIMPSSIAAAYLQPIQAQGSQLADHVQDATGYRPGFLLRKLMALPTNIINVADNVVASPIRASFTSSPFMSSSTSSSTTSTSATSPSLSNSPASTKRTSGALSPFINISDHHYYMNEDVADRLHQDAQVINACFAMVLNFAALSPDNQLQLAEEYGLRLFIRLMQRASFPKDDNKSMTREEFENEVSVLFHKPLPSLLNDTMMSKAAKMKNFLFDLQWQQDHTAIGSNNTNDHKKVGLSYNLEVSHLECFNIRSAFNSYVRVSVGSKKIKSSAQFYTTKPAYPEKWSFQVDVVEKDLLIIELINFRPLLQVIKDFVVGRVVIPLTNLVLDENYLAWYKLHRPSNLLTSSDEALDGKGETAPRRDISNIQMQVQLKLSVRSTSSPS